MRVRPTDSTTCAVAVTGHASANADSSMKFSIFRLRMVVVVAYGEWTLHGSGRRVAPTMQPEGQRRQYSWAVRTSRRGNRADHSAVRGYKRVLAARIWGVIRRPRETMTAASANPAGRASSCSPQWYRLRPVRRSSAPTSVSRRWSINGNVRPWRSGNRWTMPGTPASGAQRARRPLHAAGTALAGGPVLSLGVAALLFGVFRRQAEVTLLGGCWPSWSTRA